jgi:hypothetical protein
MSGEKASGLKDRYSEALRNLPPSGGGGCHAGLLSAANLGRIAGLSREQIERDLEAHVHGTRKVTRKEIAEAVDKAFNTPGNSTWRRTAPQPTIDGKKLLDFILKRGAKFTEKQLRDASPVQIDWKPKRDAVETLYRLYCHADHLFIGTRYDAGPEHVLPVSEWLARFERGAAVPEYIIPNPLTGQQGFTNDDKPSWRADLCVTRFCFAVIEHDQMPRDQQIQFWAGVPLPIVALIDSGGKSIHGWVRMDADNAEGWTERVEDKLFTYLEAVGVDGQCKNEARLSRMPGHFRTEKGRFQRVLYLNPKGGSICE